MKLPRMKSIRNVTGQQFVTESNTIVNDTIMTVNGSAFVGSPVATTVPQSGARLLNVKPRSR